MKNITKILLIILSTTILFNCSDDNPETTPENYSKRLDSIISTDNTMKILYKYNNDNINTESEILGTNNEGEIWKEQIALSYNSNNLVNIEINKDWNGTEYINFGKIEYSYNSNLDINTKIYSNWDSGLENWNSSFIEYYNYNSGILTEIIQDDIDGHHSKKLNYIYESNILKKIERYHWDDNNNDWEVYPWKKYEYLYDTDNNLTDIIEYFDDFPNDGVWEQGDERFEFEYDNTYAIDDLILPFDNGGDDVHIFIPFNTNHMIIKMKDYEATGNNNWAVLYDFNYFYTDISN